MYTIREIRYFPSTKSLYNGLLESAREKPRVPPVNRFFPSSSTRALEDLLKRNLHSSVVAAATAEGCLVAPPPERIEQLISPRQPLGVGEII